MLAGLLLVAPIGHAAEPLADASRLEQIERDREMLQARIGSLGARLQRERAAQGEEVAALRAAELALAASSLRAKRLGESAAAARRESAQLAANRASMEDELARQREHLDTSLAADYAIARRGPLKLAFGSVSPAQARRALAYHAELRKAATRRLQAVRDAAAALQDAELRAAAASEAHDQALAGLQAERAIEAAARQQRADALALRDARLIRTETRLAAMATERAELESVVVALREALEALSEIPAEEPTHFADLHGQLPWPATGSVQTAFGSAGSSGITLQAAAGSPVRVVARGRVAFAEWLNGFGLLLVVDHGDGFLTLYGQLHTLQRNLGDWVEPGEAVATAGNSGGANRAGVYFEIRQDGKPIDPAQWFAGQPGTPPRGAASNG